MQAEWLDHQVVGPAVEAPDARFHLLAGGEHQHRQIGIEGADLLEYLLSVLDRHIQIENGQIGHLLAKRLHRGASIAGQANAISVRLQAAAQKQPQRLVVFGNQ